MSKLVDYDLVRRVESKTDGATVHDVSPVKVQTGSTHSDASGTIQSDILYFRCKADKTVFPISGPPRLLPPPILIPLIKEMSIKPGKLSTPLPPMPIAWEWRPGHATNVFRGYISNDLQNVSNYSVSTPSVVLSLTATNVHGRVQASTP